MVGGADAARQRGGGGDPSLAPSPSILGPGSQIGDYVIEELLDQGAEGDVFLARDSVLGRRVALKTLRAGAPGDPRGVEEARLMAGLEHPHIIRVYQAQRYRRTWFIALEFITGGSLFTQVGRIGPLSLADSLRLTAQASQALGYAHDCGVVHRDVKPQNLLLTGQGEIKLGDFGLAHELRARSSTNGLTGTPAFLAPECWRESLPSPLSDTYSLGACFFFMLTGRLPFPFSDIERLKQAHLQLEPKLPSRFPRAAGDLVARLMAKEPGRRPRCGAALSEQLHRLARTPSVSWSLPQNTPAESPNPLSDNLPKILQMTFAAGPDRAVLSELHQCIKRRRPVRVVVSLETEGAALALEAAQQASSLATLVLKVDLRSMAGSVAAAVSVQLDPDESGDSLSTVLSEFGSRVRQRLKRLPVIEVHLDHTVSQERYLELCGFVSVAAAEGVLTLVYEVGRLERSWPREWATLRLATAEASGAHFRQRIEAWFQVGTGGKLRCSGDAMLLLQHSVLRQGVDWDELCAASALVACGVGAKIVTTWSVLRGVECLLKEGDDELPPPSPPTAWPDHETLTLLKRLRGPTEPRARNTDDPGDACSDYRDDGPSRALRRKAKKETSHV